MLETLADENFWWDIAYVAIIGVDIYLGGRIIFFCLFQ